MATITVVTAGVMEGITDGTVEGGLVPSGTWVAVSA